MKDSFLDLYKVVTGRKNDTQKDINKRFIKVVEEKNNIIDINRKNQKRSKSMSEQNVEHGSQNFRGKEPTLAPDGYGIRLNKEDGRILIDFFDEYTFEGVEHLNIVSSVNMPVRSVKNLVVNLQLTIQEFEKSRAPGKW